MWKSMSYLERFFRAFGVIECIIGVVASFLSFPANPVAGAALSFVSYSGSVIWFGGGIVVGMLSVAVGNAVYYLRIIMESTVASSGYQYHKSRYYAAFTPQESPAKIRTPDKIGSRDVSPDWKCPQCGVENAGDTFKCKGCSYRLV